MHRFFVPPGHISGSQVEIMGEEARHLAKVLRLIPGNTVLVFDGTGKEYVVRLLHVEGGRARGEITGENTVEREPPLKVALAQGIGKGEKMDFIVQKAVELGVSQIYPLVTERGIVRLAGDKARLRVDRWQKIAREACKQSGRTLVPEVKDIAGLEEILKEQRDTPGVFFYEAESHRSLKSILKDNSALFRKKGLFLYIGPEGGFSRAEVDLARHKGLLFAGLGPRILRTETAGLVAVAAVLYELGDIGGGI